MNPVKYIIIPFILIMAGCNSYRSAVVTSKEIARNNTTHLPLLVDLSIDDNRVSGTYSGRAADGVEYAKSQAVAAVLKKTNADVLFEPQYLIENTGNFINIEVSGHPAHYKNFRTATCLADTSVLTQRLNVVAPSATAITPGAEPLPKSKKKQ